ncbi:MAG: glycosyltransferase family 1 protein [Candidatus Dormibacteria bacterium]
MRPILIDARPLQGDSASRGIGTYLRGLLDGMAGIGFATQVAVLLSRGAPEPGDLAGRGLEVGARTRRLERRAQVLADPFLTAKALRGHPARLYHAVEYGQPRRATLPVVVTVHDLIPFLLPGYSWRSRLLRRPGLRLLHRADAVITPSSATARDCIRIGGVAPERIHVVPHGLSPRYRPAPTDEVEGARARFGLRRPYLLGVGTFEPRKGLPHLVEVTRRLRRDHDIDLVVAGQQGMFEPAVRAQLATLGEHGRELGFVETADLVALYGGAAAFVFPSAYEGFGLPLLEAMGCGAVAVGFQNSSLPEVAGEAAVLVPDGDEAALLTALEHLLSEPDETARRRRLGLEHAASFTWETAARSTVAVYEAALGEALL